MDTIFLPQMPDPGIPSGLFERVSGTIQLARVHQLLRRVALAVVGLVGSVSYAISQWSAFWQEASSSSFVEYLRLAVSDPDVVFAHAQDFTLGLLEALPVGTIFMVSLSAFFFIGVVVALDALRHARRGSHFHSLSLT